MTHSRPRRPLRGQNGTTMQYPWCLTYSKSDRQLNAPQCALRNFIFDYEGLNAIGTISLDKNSCGLAVAPAPDRGPL